MHVTLLYSPGHVSLLPFQARFHNTNIEINMLEKKHRIKLELNRCCNNLVALYNYMCCHVA